MNCLQFYIYIYIFAYNDHKAADCLNLDDTNATSRIYRGYFFLCVANNLLVRYLNGTNMSIAESKT